MIVVFWKALELS